MPSVSPIKKSPIAAYLTACKAYSKRTGNTWHFYSEEGAYIGRQIKIEQNNVTTYLREVYADGFKNLFYECKLLAQRCVYVKDKKFPIGITVLPTYSYILSQCVNLLSNEVKTVQKEINLLSNRTLKAIDENTFVGIFEVEKPYIYKERISTEQTSTLPKHYQRHRIYS